MPNAAEVSICESDSMCWWMIANEAGKAIFIYKVLLKMYFTTFAVEVSARWDGATLTWRKSSIEQIWPMKVHNLGRHSGMK
jgi:hypothetical protein